MAAEMRSPRWSPRGAGPPSPPSPPREEEDERRRSEADEAPRSPRWASPRQRAARSAPPSPQASPRRRSAREAWSDFEAPSPRNALLAAAIAAPFALVAGSALRGAREPEPQLEADAPQPQPQQQSQQSQSPRRVPAASPRGRAQQPPPPPAARIVLLSLNVGGVACRWRERLPEIRALIAATQPDAVALQAVLCCEAGQDASILGPRFTRFGCRAAVSHMARFGGLPSALYCLALRCALAARPLAALLAAAPAALAWVREALAPADALLLLAPLARGLQAPFLGNCIAVRTSDATSSCVVVGAERHETLPLGHYRVAQRVLLTLQPAGGAPLRVWLVNVHLHHGGATPAEQASAFAAPPAGAAAAAAVRAAQAKRLLTWLDAALAADKAAPRRTAAAAVLLAGGLNAPPGEAAHDALLAWGFAHVAPPCAPDAPPTPTWPTPLKAPQKEWGAPAAVDALLARPLRGAALRVLEARRCGEASAGDAQLYPSDHYALLARLEITAPPDDGDDAAPTAEQAAAGQ